MKYILFVGEILPVPTTLKCAKQYKNKFRESRLGKNRFCYSSPGKGAMQ